MVKHYKTLLKGAIVDFQHFRRIKQKALKFRVEFYSLYTKGGEGLYIPFIVVGFRVAFAP